MALRAFVLLAAVTCALAAGAAPPGAPAVSAPGDASAPAVSVPGDASAVEVPRADRLLVAPLNLTVRAPEELEGKTDPVWQALLGYFQQRDRRVDVLDGIAAERLWLHATADLDLSDRQAALRTATARFAREAAQERAFDVLVVPSLVLRAGRLSGHHASWDGVQRVVPNAAQLIARQTSDVAGPGQVSVARLRGKVGAASLHVSLLRADGTEIYQGLGGLDVVQELVSDAVWDGRMRFATRSDPFSDPEALREGIERAFEGPTLAASSAP